MYTMYYTKLFEALTTPKQSHYIFHVLLFLKVRNQKSEPLSRTQPEVRVMGGDSNCECHHAHATNLDTYTIG